MPVPTTGAWGGQTTWQNPRFDPGNRLYHQPHWHGLNNLPLAASNDTTFLRQLKDADLVLTALVSLLTMANKKLAKALATKKDW
jgi:hypothetical protein